MSKPITDYVPFYRDAKRAVGAINRVMAIPCAIPAAVYIEAAVQGAWKLGYNIASPDPKEVYHQLIGNSLYHDIKNFTESTHILSPRDESIITRGLFFVADVVDVAAWYMFLFGSAVDGLVDFSTQVQRYAGCQTKQSPNFFSGGPYINAISDDGSFGGLLFAGKFGDGTDHVGESFFQTHNGNGGFCAATTKFETFGGHDVPSTTAILNVHNEQIMDQGFSNPESEGKQKYGHAFYKTVNSHSEIMSFAAKAAYTGGDPLPLHEAFRSGNNWFGFCYSLNI